MSGKNIKIIAVILILAGIGYFYFTPSGEEKAIELVKNAKSTRLNILGQSLTDQSQTWLDFANEKAAQYPSTNFEWSADQWDDDIFLVKFTDASGTGQYWEANLYQETVILINNNKYEEKEYGITNSDVKWKEAKDFK